MPFTYDISLPGLALMHQIDALSRTPDHDQPIPLLDATTEFGRTRFTSRLAERHLNPFGVVHGGFTCGLLDSAAGMAAHSTLPPQSWLATVDLNVRFLRTIKPGAELLVEGAVVHQTKQLIVTESRIADADGRPLATASGTFMVKTIDAASA